MLVQSSKEMFVGPCNIDLKKIITASKHPAMARSQEHYKGGKSTHATICRADGCHYQSVVSFL
jgi:hypothetical protein